MPIYDNTPADPTRRGHPLRDLLTQLAHQGGQLTRDDLKALPVGTHRAVMSAADRIAKARAVGDRSGAWEIADDATAAIANNWPTGFQLHDEPDEPTNLDDLAREMFES